MPLNSTQRPIFVYLRSKNDHKSCTPARAKLTNEYTHRTNKNDPSTISVIPSQLCTFFRKRTIHVENLKSPRGYFSFSTWARFISSEVSCHSSEVSFDSSEEFFLFHVGISKYPRGNHFSPTRFRFDIFPTLNYCCKLASDFPSTKTGFSPKSFCTFVVVRKTQ